MSKSDEEAITFVVLFLAGTAILALVFWLVGSTIQFLSDNRFIYGLLVGLPIGSVVTFGIIALRNWWNNRD